MCPLLPRLRVAQVHFRYLKARNASEYYKESIASARKKVTVSGVLNPDWQTHTCLCRI